jgi:hypothetical protein
MICWLIFYCKLNYADDKAKLVEDLNGDKLIFNQGKADMMMLPVFRIFIVLNSFI